MQQHAMLKKRAHMKKRIALLFLALTCRAGIAPAQADPVIALSHAVTGEPFEYVIQRKDTLTSIAAQFAEPATAIAQDNGINYNGRIFPGQTLKIDNRHVVPESANDGILINLPQRLLFFFREGNLAGSYPVGLGRPSWPTPSGEFHVVELRKNPTWTVPVSIQEEMRREREVVLTKVPPGPDNPLGQYWIGLSLPGYGIHGTNAPPSVYHFQSHGCIRLQPKDVEKLFPEVKIGTAGRLIYAPVLLAVLDDGRIYLEVNPDIYHKGAASMQTLKELAESRHLADRIDWQKAAQVIKQKEGLARPIGLQAGKS
jgi:L,D-transpeptidase ErfK/SrfK